MGSAISTVYLGLAYCFCTASGNLCNACLGTTLQGTTGRKRAVLLLAITIVLSLFFQYKVAPSIVLNEGWIWKCYRAVPGMGKMVYKAWKDPYCESYEDQVVQCAGNAGVFRPTSLATLFFLVSAVATKLVPAINREAWLSKYTVFFFGIFFTMLIPNAPLFIGFFLWFARLGATVFVLLQQVILIDIAYNWNEDWVEKSNECDRLSYGSGQKWLRAIVSACVGLYSLAIIGISLLYRHFQGCPENIWVITLTLLGILAMTGIQLSGHEGSLLTSGVMSLYAAYLAFSIVSKNPNGACNPRLGHDDSWGIAIGLALTFLSLAWTGWSWSAEQRLNVQGVQAPTTMSPASTAPNPDTINLDVPFLDPDEQPTSGIVTEQNTADPNFGTDLWKLNVVLALISCWVAMTLTGWGTIEEIENGSNAANPQVGRWNMAMIGISQWLAIGLYIWTLVAPRVFPNRDFSY